MRQFVVLPEQGEQLPCTPQTMGVRGADEHKHPLASHDIDGKDSQAVADIPLIDTRLIQPECRLPVIFLFEGFHKRRQLLVLQTSVVVPRVSKEMRLSQI